MIAKQVLAILDSREFYGKERANLLVYEILKKNGLKITVLYNDSASPKLISSLNSFNSLAVPFPRMLKGRFLALRYISRFFATNVIFFYRLVQLKPDFILVPTEIALSYLILPLVLTRSKVVFRVGDDPIVLRFKGFIAFAYRFLWRGVMIKRVNTFVCITKYIRQSLINSGQTQQNQFRVIYNLPPRVLYENPGYGIQPKGSGVIGDHVTFGFIGRVVKEKGVHVLIESAAKLLQEGLKFKIIIAGSLLLDKNYGEDILRNIAHSSLGENVVFMDEIEDVGSFYNQIDVLCVPSVYNEPSGNVIVEAKAYGLPSIIFNLGGMPELVRHLEDGYICDTATPKGLFDAMRFYLNRPIYIKLHGARAKDSLFRPEFTFSRFESDWLAVFS